MADPSVERFRRVVESAYANLEARREEVNDLNVFPVADGDTGDNMALTMRAVVAELDRIAAEGGESPDRAEIIHAVARAALMGARGNSGVILSQIVRGAAEELATRPGELVDPVLVSAAFVRAADAARESVRDPVEGTMLTVVSAMAEAADDYLERLGPERGRLLAGGSGVAPERQDELLAGMLAAVAEAGEAAVRATTSQLDVLAEAGVVDAGAHGLVLILAGALAGLRGEDAPIEIPKQPPARHSALRHSDSLYRYCVNFIVSGEDLEPHTFVSTLEQLGDSVLVVGDSQTLKVHVHSDDPIAARAVFAGVGVVSDIEEADMREQIAARQARITDDVSGCGALAVVSGAGLRRLYEELGATIVDGGTTMNPSTDELLAGIDAAGAESVLILPNSPNVLMAAERAAQLSGKSAAVLPATSQQAGLIALLELDPEGDLDENRQRLEESLGEILVGAVAPAARDDPQGRFLAGDAVGFAEGELTAWGEPGETLAATIAALADGAEIVTLIEGEGAPLSLAEAGALVGAALEVDSHVGGQAHYWWLLAIQ